MMGGGGLGCRLIITGMCREVRAVERSWQLAFVSVVILEMIVCATQRSHLPPYSLPSLAVGCMMPETPLGKDIT